MGVGRRRGQDPGGLTGQAELLSVTLMALRVLEVCLIRLCLETITG